MADLEKSDSLDQAKEEKELIEREIKWFKEKYGIEVVQIQKKEERVRGIYGKRILPPSAGKVIKLLKGLKEQIVRLPSFLIKKANLKKISLCEDIKNYKVNDGEEIGYAHGFVDPSSDCLQIYIGSSFCFYHELYHGVAKIENEYYDDQYDLDNFAHRISLQFFKKGEKDFVEAEKKVAEAEKKTAEARKKIEKWRQLDPNDKNVSLKNFNEERANYFAYLLNTDKKDWYFDEEDPPYPAKIKAMKKFMKKWSGELLDNQFFKDIKAGKVDEYYWDKKQKK